MAELVASIITNVDSFSILLAFMPLSDLITDIYYYFRFLDYQKNGAIEGACPCTYGHNNDGSNVLAAGVPSSNPGFYTFEGGCYERHFAEHEKGSSGCPTLEPYRFPCTAQEPVMGGLGANGDFVVVPGSSRWTLYRTILELTIVAGIAADLMNGCLTLGYKGGEGFESFGAYKGLISVFILVFEDVSQLWITYDVESDLRLSLLESCGYEYDLLGLEFSQAAQINMLFTIIGMVVRCFKANKSWEYDKDAIPCLGGVLVHGSFKEKICSCTCCIFFGLLITLSFFVAEETDFRFRHPDVADRFWPFSFKI